METRCKSCRYFTRPTREYTLAEMAKLGLPVHRPPPKESK